MNLRRKYIYSLILLLLSLNSFAQPNTTIDLEKDKPDLYKARLLRSEKTTEGKLKWNKRFYNNLVSKFNYNFNANNRLNDLIAKAKLQNKDDYTKLLNFYNYTLDGTTGIKGELDTVIYKCNAGILLHDLRSDWVDDLYLLLGKAYMFRKNFDSAYRVFQYINYIYAPKDDGYDIPIGSNASNNDGIFTVSTNEKTSLIKKLTKYPLRRNDCLLWMVRNYTEQKKLSEASGLVSILQSDPVFPKRLQKRLYENIAYLRYNEQSYDSSARYLLMAINNAEDRGEKSRWYYLIGQMLHIAKKDSASLDAFNKAIKYSIDPYLEVYARLNIVRIAAGNSKGNSLNTNLEELYKMARRDKYAGYRDIIYYATGTLQIQQKEFKNADRDLLKSVKFSNDNPEQKQKSFLLLADINYDNKKFVKASEYYDSVIVDKLTLKEDKDRVLARRTSLKDIVQELANIHLQDSIQDLSKLPYEDRVKAIKKLYRRLKREQGLKDDSGDIDYGNIADNSTNQTPKLVFSSDVSTSDFYFNSATQLAQGLKDFKIKWGSRPNVDNWRRQSAADQFSAAKNGSFNPPNPMMSDVDVDAPSTANDKEKNDSAFLTFEGMLLNIPVTKTKKDTSDHKLVRSLLNNGNTFQEKLEEYPTAVDVYEEIFKRYKDPAYEIEAWYNLANAYRKMNKIREADSVLALMNKKYSAKEIDSVAQIKNARPGLKNATNVYENIYQLFYNENYEKAVAAKAKADSIFGRKYWTPQLLFIESVYYIKLREDSTAISKLKIISDSLPKSDLTEKAKKMIEVLKRRPSIERYLKKLQINVPEDPLSKRVILTEQGAYRLPSRHDADSILMHTLINISQLPAFTPKKLSRNFYLNLFGFDYSMVDTNYVIIAMYHQDMVYVNEAKKAFAAHNSDRNNVLKVLTTYTSNYSADTNFIVMMPFLNTTQAFDYLTKKKPIAGKISPILKPGTFDMFIISKGNYDIMQKKKNLAVYMDFIKEIFKGQTN